MRGETFGVSQSPGFSDWDQIAGYAQPAVSALTDNGIVNGMGDGTFAPEAPATRAEAAKLIDSMLTFLENGGHA